ncbi:MAG: hypothetical protein ABI904_00660 [Chloroflexota bacterium]
MPGTHHWLFPDQPVINSAREAVITLFSDPLMQRLVRNNDV